VRRFAVVAALVLPGAAPEIAAAQDHSMHKMPGMQMPGMAMPPARKTVPKTVTPQKNTPKKAVVKKTGPNNQEPKSAGGVKPAPKPAAPMMDHHMMDHSKMPIADAPTSGAGAPVGTALPAGDAPAPPVPTGHYADRFFDPAAMARARDRMMREQGGQRFAQVMMNLAEVQIRDGRDGYRWDGEAWFGGDIDRLVIKSEGEGDVGDDFGSGVGDAEVQALFSRAVGPYFNLQGGIRHDFAPSPTRNYATIGVEGLAPYMFEVGAAAFVSTKGDVLARVEGYYDQRVTQRLVLQPRVEFNLAAQDVPENRYGAGLVDTEIGLRLRYEIRREFAPYLGVSHAAKVGRSARFARADGNDPSSTSLVAGVRVWF